MRKLVILFIIFYINVTAQDKFKADFDYAVFPSEEKMGVVELYYSFYQPGMEIINVDNKNYVAGLLGVKITDAKADTLVLQKEYNFKTPYNNSSDKNLTGLLRYSLPPGKYVCNMVGQDFTNRTKQDTANFTFEMRAPSNDRFSISDIQMASSIKDYNTDPNSYFYKNTLEVVPNPGLIYGENLPVLYFYTEFYNVDKNKATDNLKIGYYIFDSANRLRYKKEKFVSRNNSSIVEIGAINMKSFPSGIYTLVVAGSDSVKDIKIKSSKKFYVYSPGVEDKLPVLAEQDVFESELATYTEDELDEYFAMSKYIATLAEQRAWKKLTNIEGKRRFLYDFWKKRDEIKETPENETKKEYFERVEFANNAFRNLLQKKGWKTDRGRVYIIYGKPTNIERHPNEQDSKPYEIWYYDNIEKGVRFVFADFTDFKDYRLIHSDKLGELSDQNWEQRIRR